MSVLGGDRERRSVKAAGAAAVGAAVAGLAAHDLVQRRHALLRNFPVVGHFRYWLEAIGPELRQYIVTSNDEERPFSRDQRRWVYASSKKEVNTFGFGTDNEVEAVQNLLVIKHSAFPEPAPAKGTPGGAPDYEVPAAKVLGASHGRRLANERGVPVGALGLKPQRLAELAKLIDAGKLAAGEPAGKVMERLLEQDAPAEQAAADLGLIQVSDTGAIDAALDALFAENPPALQDYRGGKKAARGALIGMVMKKGKGFNAKVVGERLDARVK